MALLPTGTRVPPKSPPKAGGWLLHPGHSLIHCNGPRRHGPGARRLEPTAKAPRKQVGWKRAKTRAQGSVTRAGEHLSRPAWPDVAAGPGRRWTEASQPCKGVSSCPRGSTEDWGYLIGLGIASACPGGSHVRDPEKVGFSQSPRRIFGGPERPERCWRNESCCKWRRQSRLGGKR